MALSKLGQDAVSRACQTAQVVLETVKPVLDALDILYNSAGGLKSTIQQADLDAIPSFSGLTKQQLDDGLFALTATLKTDITNAFTQLEQLAARA
jgi:hypothetical protein